MHHTKTKGDLGVHKAKADLCEKGYMILSPETEHAPFDLVIYDGSNFYRVQVKYRSIKNGKLLVEFVNTHSDRHGIHKTNIDKDQVDLYCVYCPETDECYYLDPNQYGSNVSIRIDAPKNNQVKDIVFAKDCKHVPLTQ